MFKVTPPEAEAQAVVQTQGPEQQEQQILQTPEVTEAPAEAEVAVEPPRPQEQEPQEERLVEAVEPEEERKTETIQAREMSELLEK